MPASRERLVRDLAEQGANDDGGGEERQPGDLQALIVSRASAPQHNGPGGQSKREQRQHIDTILRPFIGARRAATAGPDSGPGRLRPKPKPEQIKLFNQWLIFWMTSGKR